MNFNWLSVIMSLTADSADQSYTERYLQADLGLPSAQNKSIVSQGKIYRICHELTVEIKFYETSPEKCY